MAEIIPLTQASESAIAAPTPLSDQHEIAAFDCGKPPLTDWLRHQARRSEGRSARAFVVTCGKIVIGYYCLSAGAVMTRDLPKSLKWNMPNQVPVMVIGRLAVDKVYHGQGLGSAMLKDALRRILGVSQHVGARAVMIHAIDDDAKAFYASYGFKPFPSDSRTMFLSISDIAAALA